MTDTPLVPIAISSEIDAAGDERIHAANYSKTSNIRSTYTINGTLILVGSGGLLVTAESPFSTYTFTNRNTIGYTLAMNAIAGCNTLVIVGVAFGKVLVSTDRVNYLLTTVTALGSNNSDAVAYGDGTFVITGGSAIVTTTDGVTFTTRTSPFTGVIRAAGYGNGTFVLGAGNGQVAYSTDAGATWTLVDAGFTTDGFTFVESIHYANGLWVAAGVDGQLATSPDGIVWTQHTSNVASTIYSSAYGNGVHIVVGDDGAIATSSDGITWAAGAIPGHSGFRSTVTFIINKFYATDQAGGVAAVASESTDGQSWTQVTAPSNDTRYALGSLFVQSN